MYVGAFRIDLFLPGVRNIKDRRRILHSLRDTLRKNNNFSFADISENSELDKATVGIAVVTKTHESVRRALEHIVDLVEKTDALISDIKFEIFTLEE